MDDDAHWSALLRPRSAEALVGSLAVLFLLALAGIMPAQNDTWWNLAAGRDIVTSRAVDLVDHFSWTARGHYWSNHEWLAQVLFYGAYALGGMPLLTAVAMLFVWVAVLLVWRLMAGPPLLRALLLFVSCSLFVTEFSVRPKVVTLAAVALTASLLVSRRYVWLPAVFAVWANMHGAVALGVVMLGAACAEALIHDRSRLPRLLLASVLAGAATACTPLGFSLVDDVVLSLRRPDYAYVTEWQPAGVEPWTWTLFVLVAALAVLACWFRTAVDERERVLVYLSAALLPLALRYSRNIPPFTIVAVPLLSTLLLRVNGTREAPQERQATRATARRASRDRHRRGGDGRRVRVGDSAAEARSGIRFRPPLQRRSPPVQPRSTTTSTTAVRSSGSYHLSRCSSTAASIRIPRRSSSATSRWKNRATTGRSSGSTASGAPSCRRSRR